MIFDNGYKELYFKEYAQKNPEDTLWRRNLKWLPNSTLQSNATYYEKSLIWVAADNYSVCTAQVKPKTLH